jgi:hypothetical protein
MKTIEKLKRGEGCYADQRKALGLWVGLLPYWANEFREMKVLLLDDVTPKFRESLSLEESLGSLRDIFEDLLQSAGVSTYSDGSSAFLGAYNSLYDFIAAKVVCQEFSVSELTNLRNYYERQRYLSPIFGLVFGSCRDAIEKRTTETQNSKATGEANEQK